MRRIDKLSAIKRATKMLCENYVSENLPIAKADNSLETSKYIDLTKFLELTDGVAHRPRIFCKDGFNVSVQGSNNNYSSPASEFGPYESMELGFPSQGDELIKAYMEGRYNIYDATVDDSDDYDPYIDSSYGRHDDDNDDNFVTPDPTKAVYPYTPIEVISKLIDKHGGIDVLKTKEANTKQR
jgi:hypothetical protein